MFKQIRNKLNKLARLSEDVMVLREEKFKHEREIKLLKLELSRKNEAIKLLGQKKDNHSGCLYCVFQLQPEQPDSFLDLYKVFSSRESAELFIKTIKEEMPNTKWIWESWRLHK
ncbi:hypothetical protein ACWCQ1_51550 [Streptomyces sp. NPDC002144]|uniref:hypothetical protein n=1 Tax=Bacilli TaxID=91061 RepID=UPI00255656DF|nr:hypothetical protein [Streptococcus agalactiae]MDK8746843.1 hypothetical protein [Streptococcus agalactiae]